MLVERHLYRHFFMKEIKLTQGKVAIVDDDTFEELNKFKWHASNEGRTQYAVRTNTAVTIKNKNGKYSYERLRMHRVLMNASTDFFVDHKNGNGLDNRKNNLRLCSRTENARNRGKNSKNSTGYKGVTKRKNGRYQASIGMNGKSIIIGYYNKVEDAAFAYNIVAKLAHKEFARLNLFS